MVIVQASDTYVILLHVHARCITIWLQECRYLSATAIYFARANSARQPAFASKVHVEAAAAAAPVAAVVWWLLSLWLSGIIQMKENWKHRGCVFAFYLKKSKKNLSAERFCGCRNRTSIHVALLKFQFLLILFVVTESEKKHESCDNGPVFFVVLQKKVDKSFILLPVGAAFTAHSKFLWCFCAAVETRLRLIFCFLFAVFQMVEVVRRSSISCCVFSPKSATDKGSLSRCHGLGYGSIKIYSNHYFLSFLHKNIISQRLQRATEQLFNF